MLRVVLCTEWLCPCMHLVCAFSGCSALVSALFWVLLSCVHPSSHTPFSLSAYVHSHCVPSVPAHVCFPPCWQSIWRPVEPPYLACASIQVAWLHSGSVATLRPAATHSPMDAPALALLHTLDLRTPCRCSYCCAVVTSLFFTILFSLYVYYFSLFLFALCLWVRVMYILRTATWGAWICPPGHPHLHCLGLVWCRLFSVCAAWADPCLGSRGDPWQLVCTVCKAVSIFPVVPVEQGIFCCS